MPEPLDLEDRGDQDQGCRSVDAVEAAQDRHRQPACVLLRQPLHQVFETVPAILQLP